MLNNSGIRFNFLDKMIMQCDALLRDSTMRRNNTTLQTNPAASITTESTLSEAERRKTIAMMRINHTGEVCAQALYQGQALMAKSPQQYNALLRAADEENDHLLWCSERLTDLRGRPSLLNPFWFAGSYAIGVLAGLGGDRISLGFVVETERQVTAHLDKHLNALAVGDHKTRVILEQMRRDELQHATAAQAAGACELSWGFKTLMRCTAKVMTVTVAYV